MSMPTNPTTDMQEVRHQLEMFRKTFDETFEDVSSAKNVIKTVIDRTMSQFPLSKQGELKLGNQFLELADRCAKIESSGFCSILGELAQLNEKLHQLAAYDEAAQDYSTQALSETELAIINKADEDPPMKCLCESYEFFLRLDELKHNRGICLSLAVFPNNAVLRKRLLIYWWIGEGLVRHEEEGERVFQELLDLEFLIPHDKCPRVSKCRIFPWFRYMLISVALREKLLKLDQGKIPRFDPAHSQRTCLIDDRFNSEIETESTPETWRTIFNVNGRDLHFRHQWLATLKTLAVLQLGRWQVSPTYHIEVRDESFLKGLKTQKLLKYLSLRGISRITSLPDSIRELASLEILDLKACHNLETLPAVIASLKKLTHLDVSECYLLESLPKGLDKLTSLQVLKGFIIGSSQKTPIRIWHLRSLKNLKRLSIHIGSEANIQGEEFEKLKDLEKVKCLKISWGKTDAEKSVSFPPWLQKLDLEGIPHDRKPEWLKPSKLMNLETLHIKGGRLRNLLDEEGRWENVKYLVLKYTKMPPVNQETLRSRFPSLQYVKKVEWAENVTQEVVEYEWNKVGAVTD
ncbi:disease resistance RPP13-like protein 4 [Neltuma alba]|uniref:disease resistance RPP13-like protein 4 n=1 Tax=Neltuma alba TaxID=207710 RepID=UPI0010A50657|nr:disease resistance RPP13-like protein 4 [Prosopis alba]